MLKNYFKIALRNLWRKKVYATINILGLVLGMTCAFLLYLYIQDELSFDDYHKDKDSVYLIETKIKFGDRTFYSEILPGKLSKVLKNKSPEVIEAPRMYSTGGYVVNIGTKKYKQDEVYFTEPALFKTLTVSPVTGNVHTALVQPQSIVLTRSLSQKYFRGPKNALGKTLQIGAEGKSYLVKAVIEDIPKNSYFRPEMFISLSSLYKTKPKLFNSWKNYNFMMYVKLKPGTSPQKVEATLKNIYHTQINPKKSKGSEEVTMYLTSLTDLHLHSKTIRKSKTSILYTFSVIAVLILLIACANYMNLATARSIERAREVGIRKVVGSYRGQLIQQFLLESVMLSLLAFMISLSLIELLLPGFNQLTDKALVIGYTSKPEIVLSLLGIALFTGLLSGSYPALVLSGFKPYQVLKGRFSHSGQGSRLRKTLVVFQFSISTIMIIGTGVVYLQMRYVATKDLGFDKDQTMVLAFEGDDESKKYPVIAAELLKNPDIISVGGASFGINSGYNESSIYMPQADGGYKGFMTRNYVASKGFIKTLGLKILQGKSFEQLNSSQYGKQLVVNEAFVKKYGLKNPIGQRIGVEGKKGKPTKFANIVGVIADFHNQNLYRTIEPAVINLAEANSGELYFVYAKLRPQNMQKTVAYVKDTWNKLQPKYLYNGVFLDQRFERAYRKDQKRGQIFLMFSGLTVFIACMGLFGLASFTANQHSKEIGIRKVLGASVTQILTLLSGGFVRLVAISSLIAFPLAYYFMNQWLQNFAYHISIHWGIFVLAGMATLLISLLTVGVQSFKTAQVNPVDVLKDE